MSILKKILGDQRGAAAVEFAMVVPVLASIAILIPDVTQAATGAINMNAAVRAGIQYAMNGGTSSSSIQTFANRNWIAKPNNATMTASLACYCDSSVISCGQPCAGATSSFVTVAATATVGSGMISLPLHKTQTVRVQ